MCTFSIGCVRYRLLFLKNWTQDGFLTQLDILRITSVFIISPHFIFSIHLQYHFPGPLPLSASFWSIQSPAPDVALGQVLLHFYVRIVCPMGNFRGGHCDTWPYFRRTVAIIRQKASKVLEDMWTYSDIKVTTFYRVIRTDDLWDDFLTTVKRLFFTVRIVKLNKNIYNYNGIYTLPLALAL